MKFPLSFIHKTSLIGFLLSIFACFPLWHGLKNLPAIPVLNVFSNIPYGVTFFILAVMLIGLGASLFITKQKILTPITLLSYFVLILFDVNRFHPEYYFFSLTLLIVYLFETKKVSEQNALLLLRLLISAIYVFTGLHKMTEAFVPNVYTPMLRPLKDILPGSLFGFMMKLSFFIPLTEVFIGIALWVPKLKNITWKISLALHASVLILLLIHNFNYSVYPWNIAMVIFSYILCKSSYDFHIIKNIKESIWLKLAIFQLLLVPASHFFNIAGSSVSFDVYTGKYAYTYVYVTSDMYAQFPGYLKKQCKRIDQEYEDYKLYLDVWAQQEMNASIYY
ncbi:MAG TPA: hypothetical protein VGF30_12105, partial [Bacteroidia bacterium]